MTQYLGIIGGSGLYSISAFKLKNRLKIETPYGPPSGDLMVGELDGVNVIFLPRHGEHHTLNPSEIPFRANVWALKKAGVKAVISVSAVGSLKEEIVPGHMVVIDQFFDRTRGRISTFFEKGLVAHVNFAHPVSSYLRELLISSCEELQLKCHKNGTYVCMEGPLYSTVAESEHYRSMGASVIGMTNLQEAKLCREAELDYATLALATDYDCWHQGHDSVTTDQVIAVLKANVENAQKILVRAVKKFDFNRTLETEGMLKNAILTHREHVSPEAVERLKPIVGKYFS